MLAEVIAIFADYNPVRHVESLSLRSSLTRSPVENQSSPPFSLLYRFRLLPPSRKVSLVRLLLQDRHLSLSRRLSFLAPGGLDLRDLQKDHVIIPSVLSVGLPLLLDLLAKEVNQRTGTQAPDSVELLNHLTDDVNLELSRLLPHRTLRTGSTLIDAFTIPSILFPLILAAVTLTCLVIVLLNPLETRKVGKVARNLVPSALRVLFARARPTRRVPLFHPQSRRGKTNSRGLALQGWPRRSRNYFIPVPGRAASTQRSTTRVSLVLLM